MGAREKSAGAIWRGITLAATISLAVWCIVLQVGPSMAAQGAEETAEARVRIVHGLAAAGPLDVYVDGAIALIGIGYGDSSGALLLASGEHDFAVTPSGASVNDALAAGTIALQSDADVYATLFGTPDAASVGLFTVATEPIEVGRARFRVISGVTDVPEIVPVFAGGSPFSEPLQFGDASQYASIDAGIYDLDMLDASSGVPLITLPGTTLAEGSVTDIVLVGQASDGTLAALVETVAVEVSRPAGRIGQIAPGACDDLGDTIADLGLVQAGQGDVVGVSTERIVAQGYGLAIIPFAALLGEEHSVIIVDDVESGGGLVACGEIGGALTENGALVIALGDEASGATGIAVLAPALEDPEATGVSIFVTSAASGLAPDATPGAAE